MFLTIFKLLVDLMCENSFTKVDEIKEQNKKFFSFRFWKFLVLLHEVRKKTLKVYSKITNARVKIWIFIKPYSTTSSFAQAKALNQTHKAPSHRHHRFPELERRKWYLYTELHNASFNTQHRVHTRTTTIWNAWRNSKRRSKKKSTQAASI